MRTTIAVDDDLFARVRQFAGVTGKSAVVREALKGFVERETARRLARMGVRCRRRKRRCAVV